MLTHPPTDGHLDFSYFGASVNDAVTTLTREFLLGQPFSVLIGIYQRVDLLLTLRLAV